MQLGDVDAKLPRSAVQRHWRTPSSFYLCPGGSPADRAGLEYYAAGLVAGELFSGNRYGEQRVVVAALGPDDALSVVTDGGDGQVKRWAHCLVYVEDGKFVHHSGGLFFELAGAMNDHAAAIGSPVSYGGSIDSEVRHSEPARRPRAR